MLLLTLLSTTVDPRRHVRIIIVVHVAEVLGSRGSLLLLSLGSNMRSRGGSVGASLMDHSGFDSLTASVLLVEGTIGRFKMLRILAFILMMLLLLLAQLHLVALAASHGFSVASLALLKNLLTLHDCGSFS